MLPARKAIGRVPVQDSKQIGAVIDDLLLPLTAQIGHLVGALIRFASLEQSILDMVGVDVQLHVVPLLHQEAHHRLGLAGIAELLVERFEEEGTP